MFAATADYFRSVRYGGLWLNYNFIHLKYNGRAPSDFQRVFSSVAPIVLCDIIMFVYDPFFWSHWHVLCVAEREYIYSFGHMFA